jgi:hypothetical protein
MSISHNPSEGRSHTRQLEAPYSRRSVLYLVPERPGGRVGYAHGGRSLHLVDIENLMGGPLGGRAALREASGAYRDAAHVAVRDHVVLGVNPNLAVEVGLEWPGARLLVRAGQDGADLALVESVEDVIWNANRYDRVIIGSGDGRFLAVVKSFKAVGIPVGVVARERSLALVLAQVASFVALLPDCAADRGQS